MQQEMDFNEVKCRNCGRKTTTPYEVTRGKGLTLYYFCHSRCAGDFYLRRFKENER